MFQDTSIQATYHPQNTMVSVRFLHQVHNTKSIGIERLKITDNISVSQDCEYHSQLDFSRFDHSSIASSKKVAPSSVTVADGFVSQWSDSTSDDWICSIPAHAKINLLQWEASTTTVKAFDSWSEHRMYFSWMVLMSRAYRSGIFWNIQHRSSSTKRIKNL